MDLNRKQVSITGFVLSSLGTLISGISLFEFPGAYVESPASGIQYHYALISGIGSKIGLGFIVTGFIFQIIEKTMGEDDSLSYWKGSTILIGFTWIISLLLDIVASSLLFR